ncbi:MAG: class A beta-lactamase-related serine hydrolase [Gemmatimonadetes bacterium]|nr:class A beta-lactamase-related serine hydrolase [Gemmatimonadota bacterium]
MSGELVEDIEELASDAGASAVAVAAHDLMDGRSLELHADRWFHAASTIKVAVLLALYDAIERGELPEDARVHVRNQFTSLADSRYYRVDASRDGNEVVYGYVGRTMRIRDLAHHMIVTSSNLATNVLVELLGPEAIRASLARQGVEGVEFRRGVEDDRAWEAGINNRVTAAGLTELLRQVAEGTAVSESASSEMLEVLLDQRFVSGIPAGLPEGTRVANKTGEISTVVHDAGVVYLPDRDPYVLAVLTEWNEDGDTSRRRKLIADISKLVLERFVERKDG